MPAPRHLQLSYLDSPELSRNLWASDLGPYTKCWVNIKESVLTTCPELVRLKGLMLKSVGHGWAVQRRGVSEAGTRYGDKSTLAVEPWHLRAT